MHVEHDVLLQLPEDGSIMQRRYRAPSFCGTFFSVWQGWQRYGGEKLQRIIFSCRAMVQLEAVCSFQF